VSMEEQKKRRTRRKFNDEFKSRAVRLVLKEGQSAAQVARDLAWSLRYFTAGFVRQSQMALPKKSRLPRNQGGLPENGSAMARAAVENGMRQTITPKGLHASPVQNDGVGWHVVPPGHGADPSVSHCWAHVPPMMQTSPDEQVPASRPHFCGLVEQANPPTRNANPAITRSRLMGGTLSQV
jgi:hypothetical protein